MGMHQTARETNRLIHFQPISSINESNDSFPKKGLQGKASIDAFPDPIESDTLTYTYIWPSVRPIE